MTHRWLWIVLITLILGAAAPGLAEETRMDLSTLLPDSIRTWNRVPGDETYDRETIFRYMNGSGELYLSFAFRSLLVRNYQDAAGAKITVELYDMARAPEAFGIFARNRAGEEAGIGQGSELHGGHLFFWRDRYFVTIFAEQEMEEARDLLVALGREIAGRIGKDGQGPALIRRFPARGLDDHSIRYFHKHTDLNHHYFLSDENILGLDASAEAVLATYGRDGTILYLLLVAFATEEIASSAHTTYLEAYTPGATVGEAVRIEDETWTASARSGRHLVAVFDAPNEKSAAGLLSEALAQLEESKR